MQASLISYIVMASLAVNFAAAIIMVGVVDANGTPIFTSVNTGSTTYKGEEYADDFILNMEKEVQASGSIEDRGNLIYRVLDTIGLGFILRFLEVIDQYMFGFVNMLDSIIGVHLAPPLKLLLFGAEGIKFGLLKTLISIAYTIFGISMFTGRDIIRGN